MVRDKVLKKGILITQGQENKKRVLGCIIWKLGGPSANIDVRKEKSGLVSWLEDSTIKERELRGRNDFKNSRKSTRVKMEHTSTSKPRGNSHKKQRML